MLRRDSHLILKILAKYSTYLAMTMAGDIKFDPALNNDNALEAFNEFVANYHYTYDALNTEAPRHLEDAGERRRWVAQDKKRVFWRRHASRSLQKELEATKTENEIAQMDFNTMVAAFQDRFGLHRQTRHWQIFVLEN